MFINHNKFDYLGRIETLSTDFQAIANRIGVKSNLGWANRSQRAESKTNLASEVYADYTPAQLRQLPQYPGYTEFYTPELLALVKQRYTEDVENFGYQFGG